ncbi:MAG: flavin reductase family protein [Lachnospiraceae bacterium]|jgi:flavin reductase (DIM6/NTAB) family NADH-FMN oxidoreductase RutF
MKRKIDLNEYGTQILKAIPQGVLLNTKVGQKFDSMVIGWGGIGTNWGLPVFTVYVREGRFTRQQLDANPEFTVSVPLDGVNAEIARVCGRKSGRNTDKVSEAGLTLEEPEVNHVPGIREYPLTLECRVLYRQAQELDRYPEKALKFYPQDVGSENCGANKDVHVMYIGEIVDAYIIG